MMDEYCKCGAVVDDFTVVCSKCGNQVHSPERVIEMYAIHLKHNKSALAEKDAEIARLKGLLGRHQDVLLKHYETVECNFCDLQQDNKGRFICSVNGRELTTSGQWGIDTPEDCPLKTLVNDISELVGKKEGGE